MTSEVRCTCTCGQSQVVVAGPQLGRVRCHCTICQAANQGPYADSTILLAKYVPRDRVDHVRFKVLKKPPALKRGYCSSCGGFVVAYTRALPFIDLAFVPVACYPANAVLPEPEMHVYYRSRIADVDDDLPKYDTWPSLLAVLRVIFREQKGRAGRA